MERLEAMRCLLKTEGHKYDDEEMASIIADLRSMDCNLPKAALTAAREIAGDHLAVGVSESWIETVAQVIHGHFRAMT